MIISFSFEGANYCLHVSREGYLIYANGNEGLIGISYDLSWNPFLHHGLDVNNKLIAYIHSEVLRDHEHLIGEILNQPLNGYNNLE